MNKDLINSHLKLRNLINELDILTYDQILKVDPQHLALNNLYSKFENIVGKIYKSLRII